MIATPPDSVTFFAHVACSGLIRPALVFVSRLTNWANCFPTISGVIVTVRQPIPSPEPTISPACSGRAFTISSSPPLATTRWPGLSRMVLPIHPWPTLLRKIRRPGIFETTNRHSFQIVDSFISARPCVFCSTPRCSKRYCGYAAGRIAGTDASVFCYVAGPGMAAVFQQISGLR